MLSDLWHTLALGNEPCAAIGSCCKHLSYTVQSLWWDTLV